MTIPCGERYWDNPMSVIAKCQLKNWWKLFVRKLITLLYESSECEIVWVRNKAKATACEIEMIKSWEKGNMLQQKYECSSRPSNRSLHRYMFHHRQNHRCHLQPASSPPPPQCLVVLAAGTANSDALIRLRNCLMQLCRSSETPPCILDKYSSFVLLELQILFAQIE